MDANKKRVFALNTVSESSEQMSDPIDVLDKAKCLELLAELRHAKWFQVNWFHSLCSSPGLRLLHDDKLNLRFSMLEQMVLFLYTC